MTLKIVCLVYQMDNNVHRLAAQHLTGLGSSCLSAKAESVHGIMEDYREFVWKDTFSDQQRKDVGQNFLSFVGDAELAGYSFGLLADKVRELCGQVMAIMDGAILARVFFPRQRFYSLDPSLTSPASLVAAIGENLVKCWEKGFTFDASYFLRVEPVVSQTVYRGFFAALKEAVLGDIRRKPDLTGLFASSQAESAGSQSTDDSRAGYRDGYGSEPTNICKSEGRPVVPKDFRWPASCFSGGGLLASVLPGFESRQAQVTMAQSVVDAFETGSHMVIEAETGTGKSMAYLLPVLWWSKLRGEKVVVATHTIPLQEQLFSKDLPILARVLPFSFQAVLLKGRNNYLCPWLFEQEMPERDFLRDPIQDPIQDPLVRETMFWPMLLSWLRETKTGDISEIPQLPEWNGLWTGLCADSALCMPGRCRYSDQCFMLKARKAAQEADVIVINHSLLFKDMRLGGLPEYHYLVIDEAHNLYAGALQHLGFELSLEWVSRWLDKWRLAAQGVGSRRGGRGFGPKAGRGAGRGADRGAGRGADRGQGYRGSSYAVWQMISLKIKDLCSEQDYHIFVDTLNQCPTLATRIEEQAFQTFTLLKQILGDHFNWRLTASVLSPSVRELLKVELENLSNRLEDLDGALKTMQHSIELSKPLDGLRNELTWDRGQLTEWIVGLRQLVVLDDIERVTYLERVSQERSSLWLKSAPLDIAAILQEELFGLKDAVVLCSATLSVAGDFSYFMDELGLSDEGAGTLTLKSQFDYQNQMLSCIVSGFSMEDEDKLARDVAAFIADVAKVVGGRTLVLFTAHRLLRLVNGMLAERDDSDMPGILAQGIHGGRDALLEEFRANPTQVLLGSSSFWEGIDLPGDELTCLMMVRLPFWPPSMPVIEARSEMMVKKGQDPFHHLLLPEAVIRFKQGFGRLLRTREDKGVFILLDDRVATKRYGFNFLRSLPKRSHVRGNREQVLEKINAFFRN
ncbi:MAG: DEAD/DEAH box helicase [Peptococcaceae bacterium]|nr:DEAD/DEAH box helicase [Peptococcaceae bacterium]